MRYAGWREHEYAVDSRDDMPINPDMDYNKWADERSTQSTPTAAAKPVQSAAENKASPAEESQKKSAFGVLHDSILKALKKD